MTDMLSEYLWRELSLSLFKISELIKLRAGSPDSHLQPISIIRARYMIVLQIDPSVIHVSINRKMSPGKQNGMTIIVRRFDGKQLTVSQVWHLTIDSNGDLRKKNQMTKVSSLAEELVRLLFCDTNTPHLEQLIQVYRKESVETNPTSIKWLE
jgi:hypothetical protein